MQATVTEAMRAPGNRAHGTPSESRTALNPDNMPVVGYHSQYETVRSLSWTDANGDTHTRYYDENGRHPSGSTMAQDYVQMVVQGGALAPAWLIAGAQDHYSQLSQEAAAIEATELLHGDLAWLDSNGDGRIDSQDPAYGAIQLWLDVNGDARSQGETQSLAQAGISAIVITADGMHIERTDGSTQGLSEQDLTGDTHGVIYSIHEDAAGLLQTTEQADGSGQTVLLGANDDRWALAA